MSPRGGQRVAVFAVTDTAAQVSWRRLPGTTLTVGPSTVPVAHPDRPGAQWIAGLTPATSYDVRVDHRTVGHLVTAPALAGPVLARVATVSDLHVGQRHCGLLPTVRDPDNAEAHPVRCLRAALSEIAAWAPDLLVVKGDVADDATAEQYETAARELKAVDAPMLVLPGNHDGASHRGDDIVACLGVHGMDVTTGVSFHDLPGLRVVALGTNHPGGRHWGHLTEDRLAALAEVLREAPGPCLLTLHHSVQVTGVPTHWPIGVWGRQAHRLLRTVQRSNPATFVTTGHSHRHRLHRSRGVPVTEVGSTKDHPGVWAAYEVHGDGIRQTVRRIADPDTIAWTERTADVLLGQWGRWSPGRLADRSVTHRW